MRDGAAGLPVAAILDARAAGALVRSPRTKCEALWAERLGDLGADAAQRAVPVAECFDDIGAGVWSSESGIPILPRSWSRKPYSMLGSSSSSGAQTVASSTA